MRVTINGEERDVPDELTVAELVLLLGFKSGPVAVEKNREVVPRAQHAVTRLEGGDKLEIVQLVGGG
jgi:sulfur carrier protein